MIKFNSITKRRVLSLKKFLFERKLRREILKNCVRLIYLDHGWSAKEITTFPLESFFETPLQTTVIPNTYKDGNTSPLELLILSSFVVLKKPKTLLEIGTFNGLTTLHLALNSPPSSVVHTLDLPLLYPTKKSCFDQEDLKFIESKERENVLFKKFSIDNIQMHYGNSLEFDFLRFGQLDFAFIDGGHSYEIVKNDSEKTLKNLSHGGTILWHDYEPNTPGVFSYLNELSKTHALKHIEGTSLVIFSR